MATSDCHRSTAASESTQLQPGKSGRHRHEAHAPECSRADRIGPSSAFPIEEPNGRRARLTTMSRASSPRTSPKSWSPVASGRPDGRCVNVSAFSYFPPWRHSLAHRAHGPSGATSKLRDSTSLHCSGRSPSSTGPRPGPAHETGRLGLTATLAYRWVALSRPLWEMLAWSLADAASAVDPHDHAANRD